MDKDNQILGTAFAALSLATVALTELRRASPALRKRIATSVREGVEAHKKRGPANQLAAGIMEDWLRNSGEELDSNAA